MPPYISVSNCEMTYYKQPFIISAVDACNPNPCLNGGNCVIKANNTYNCTCPPGIGGENCTQGMSDVLYNTQGCS